jgi:hypothetical protein
MIFWARKEWSFFINSCLWIFLYKQWLKPVKSHLYKRQSLMAQPFSDSNWWVHTILKTYIMHKMTRTFLIFKLILLQVESWTRICFNSDIPVLWSILDARFLVSLPPYYHQCNVSCSMITTPVHITLPISVHWQCNIVDWPGTPGQSTTGEFQRGRYWYWNTGNPRQTKFHTKFC